MIKLKIMTLCSKALQAGRAIGWINGQFIKIIFSYEYGQFLVYVAGRLCHIGGNRLEVYYTVASITGSYRGWKKLHASAY